MSTTPTEEKPDQRPPAVYWSSAYFFAVACVYLWGYWSPFEVNILEHVGFTDVLKTAAYPIASVFVLLAIGAVLGEVIFPSGFLPSGVGRTTKPGVWLNRHRSAVAGTYFIATALYLILGPVEKWRVAPVLLAIPVSFALREAGVLAHSISSDRARTVVLFLLSALPVFAYGHGVLKANDITSGKSYKYVASEVPSQPVGKTDNPDSRPRYVGRAGEQYFFYLPTSRSLLIAPLTETKALELRSYPPPVSSSSSPQARPAAQKASGTTEPGK
jgi:hypothetical protein